MTIITRYFTHQIVLSVLMPLFVSLFLPFVTCQQESESGDRKRISNVSTRTIAGIISLGLFIASMLFCCLFCTAYRVAIEAVDSEVLQSEERSGINKNIIESFPLFLYSEVKGLKIGKGGVECAICLNEFEDEERLRWMPPCSHTFHANCIDVWLSSQSTCPVCRTNLTRNPGESFPFSSMDLETGRSVPTGNNNGDSRIPRSRSTMLLSSGRMAEIFYTRSYSTGHSLEQQFTLQGENLDRFTLQLPEEVQRNLVSSNLIRRHGYGSGSIGSSHRKG